MTFTLALCVSVYLRVLHLWIYVCEGMCVFSVLVPSYQDTRCPPLIELYKIRRKASHENNPSSQHYNKSLTFHAVSRGSIILHCCSRQQKYRYNINIYINNHKSKNFASRCWSLAWGKLIMNQKAVGLNPCTNRTGMRYISFRSGLHQWCTRVHARHQVTWS